MPLIIQIPPTYPPERQYSIQVLMRDFLGLSYRLDIQERRDVRFTNDSEKELILPDILFQTPKEDWLTLESLPKHPIPIWDTSQTPIDGPLVSPRVPIIFGNTDGFAQGISSLPCSTDFMVWIVFSSSQPNPFESTLKLNTKASRTGSSQSSLLNGSLGIIAYPLQRLTVRVACVMARAVAISLSPGDCFVGSMGCSLVSLSDSWAEWRLFPCKKNINDHPIRNLLQHIEILPGGQEPREAKGAIC